MSEKIPRRFKNAFHVNVPRYRACARVCLTVCVSLVCVCVSMCQCVCKPLQNPGTKHALCMSFALHYQLESKAKKWMNLSRVQTLGA